MQKPHRFVLDLVSSYADEGSAYLRRRRLRGRAFARVWRDSGAIEAHEPGGKAPAGDLFRIAAELLGGERPGNDPGRP